MKSTRTQDRDGNVSLGGMAGRSKKKVVGSGMDKAYVGPSIQVLKEAFCQTNLNGRRRILTECNDYASELCLTRAIVV